MMGLSVTLRNAQLNLLRDAIDADASPGSLQLYTAPRPFNGAALSSQTLLAQGTFNLPSALDADNGVLVFTDLAFDDALGNGTIAWGRIHDGSGAFVADVSVGLIGSGSVIEMNTTSVVQDVPIDVITAQLTAGNAGIQS